MAMVISHQSRLESLAAGQIKACSKGSTSSSEVIIPIINLSDPNAKSHIVEACTDLGFFKVTNHGFSMDFLDNFEAEALNFFQKSRQEKDMSGPYGYKSIGPNGDYGYLEYLLFCASFHLPVHGISDTLWRLVREYVEQVKDMTCLISEMIAEGMGNGDKKILSRLLRDEKSDSLFRLNHYPARSEFETLPGTGTGTEPMIGFGEHTDPQIISVLRSNRVSGLQICLKNGTWASVPSDRTSFYVTIGDSLQVMSNGKFQSVKHRVLANDNAFEEERLAMVYFGGPPLTENVRPLFLKEGEESLYGEFTWAEYKNSAYKTKLGDDRLATFLKSAYVPH